VTWTGKPIRISCGFTKRICAFMRTPSSRSTMAAKWSASEQGRRRKYYRITHEGRAQLAAQRQQWQAVDNTLRGIWMKACTV
jgi:hypothetical protein